MYYINKQGITHSVSLPHLAVQLWEWYLQRHVYTVSISYGENQDTNLLNRTKTLTHEWEPSSIVFSDIHICWIHPEVELCATQINMKCRKYYSSAGHRNNLLGDTLMTCWTQKELPVRCFYGLFYLVLPMPLLCKVVVKLHQHKANAILVAPQ